jgi:cytochrome c556
LGAALGKNPCPKGDKESWAKLTKKFADVTKEISDAVGKKDADAVGKAAGAFGKNCKECHDAHK